MASHRSITWPLGHPKEENCALYPRPSLTRVTVSPAHVPTAHAMSNRLATGVTEVQPSIHVEARYT